MSKSTKLEVPDHLITKYATKFITACNHTDQWDRIIKVPDVNPHIYSHNFNKDAKKIHQKKDSVWVIICKRIKLI